MAVTFMADSAGAATVGDTVDVLVTVGDTVDVLVTVGTGVSDAAIPGVVVGVPGEGMAEASGSALDSGAMTTGGRAVGAEVASTLLVGTGPTDGFALCAGTPVANAATAVACGASIPTGGSDGAHPPTITNSHTTETHRASRY